jgi:large subunit ribosomal protein L4
MASVEILNSKGESQGKMELDNQLFGVKIKPSLVHQAVVTQEANSRVAIAHTKTRSEVAGTGKKPWKQKGTGRARHGSRRSPIWVGGGITFGPRNDRNFSLKMNKTARKKALAMVLSDKVANEKLVVVDSLIIEGGKTKVLSAFLKQLPVAGKRTLLISEPENKTIAKAVKNMKGAESLPANCLNVVDLLRFDRVVMTVPAIELVQKLYKIKK